jgi:hypothetical protein
LIDWSSVKEPLTGFPLLQDMPWCRATRYQGISVYRRQFHLRGIIVDRPNELTQEQSRRLKLPDRDPYSGDFVIWAELTPAQRDDFKAVERILGDDQGRAA